MKNPSEDRTANTINKAAYEAFLKSHPQTVGKIIELLDLGWTPDQIGKHLFERLPGQGTVAVMVYMVAEHQNKLTKEN